MRPVLTSVTASLAKCLYFAREWCHLVFNPYNFGSDTAYLGALLCHVLEQYRIKNRHFMCTCACSTHVTNTVHSYRYRRRHLLGSSLIILAKYFTHGNTLLSLSNTHHSSRGVISWCHFDSTFIPLTKSYNLLLSHITYSSLQFSLSQDSSAHIFICAQHFAHHIFQYILSKFGAG